MLKDRVDYGKQSFPHDHVVIFKRWKNGFKRVLEKGRNDHAISYEKVER